MKVNGTQYRSLWWDAEADALAIIDQRWLPHAFRIDHLRTVQEFADAILRMRVRGAPLIGATAAYGVAVGMRVDPSDSGLASVARDLLATRPTAVNLRWALDRCRDALVPLPSHERASAALALAHRIADEDVEMNRAIGRHGLSLIRDIHDRTGRPVNILTHCNAGWIATVDLGTATSPIYQAHDAGIPVHVWVDETRPRNQGALTAWELAAHGVPHTYVVDNAGGLLMQRGEVDLVLTGTDRTTRRGDVCNKIGTYLKALAARDSGVPFYVALPSPTIDWAVTDGEQIVIEERDGREVSHVLGQSADEVSEIAVSPPGSPVGNWAFDVTPARLVTGLITECGTCPATEAGLAALFPDRAESTA